MEGDGRANTCSPRIQNSSCLFRLLLHIYAHKCTLNSIYSPFLNITLTFQKLDTKQQVLEKFPQSDVSAVSGIMPATITLTESGPKVITVDLS